VKICDHCGRTCGDFAGGHSTISKIVDGQWTTYDLCHPNEAGRPDCYHLVTVWGEELGAQRHERPVPD